MTPHYTTTLLQHVGHVAKDSKQKVSWSNMKGFTLEKCLMSANHARKNSIKNVIWRHMKEFIQEKFHMSAKHVRKDSIILVPWRLIKEFTQEKNLMNAKDVVKHSSKLVLWNTMKNIINENITCRAWKGWYILNSIFCHFRFQQWWNQLSTMVPKLTFHIHKGKVLYQCMTCKKSKKVIWRYMTGSTQEKFRMSAKHARKDSIKKVPWICSSWIFGQKRSKNWIANRKWCRRQCKISRSIYSIALFFWKEQSWNVFDF